MPSFRYIAKNWEGQASQGTHSAGSLREALDFLRNQNLFVVSIKEHGGPKKQLSLLDQIKETSKKKKAKSRDFMVFSRQFATMLQAGMTVLHILKIQAAQMEHPGFKDRLNDISVNVEQGGTLADGFARHPDFFPGIFTAMIETGETGGILETVMDRLAVHFEKQHDLEEKIRSATTYPIIITGVALVVMAIMVLFVLPQFANIFEEMGLEMPLITRALIAVADTVIGFWYIFLVLAAAIFFGLKRYLATEKGKENKDTVSLKIPVFGPIYQKMIVARFARTLSTLLASGVGLISSLELVERVINNVVFAHTMKRTREVIRQGQAMALPLASSGIFPPMMVEMLHVGEETGTVDKMLNRSADFYEQEVSFILDRLGTIIEPIMLIGIGIFVGLLIISIVTPMFQIYDMI